MPLKNFLNVYSTGDYSKLFKWPFFIFFEVPYLERLSFLWSDIVLEYGNLEKNGQIEDTFVNQKKIAQLQNAYIVVKSFIITI